MYKEKSKEKRYFVKKHSYGLLFSENDCRKEQQKGKKVKWLKDYQVCIDSKDEALFRIKAAFFRPDKQLRKMGIKNAKDAFKGMMKKITPKDKSSSESSSIRNKKTLSVNRSRNS